MYGYGYGYGYGCMGRRKHEALAYAYVVCMYHNDFLLFTSELHKEYQEWNTGLNPTIQQRWNNIW